MSRKIGLLDLLGKRKITMPDTSNPTGSISSLYPQPNQQQPNALLSDPAKLVGMLNQLQDYQIRQQQAPALAQIPAAQLQGQNTANQTALIQQRDFLRKGFTTAVVNSLAAKAATQSLKEDDVHNEIVNATRIYWPEAGAVMVGPLTDHLLGNGVGKRRTF